MIAMGCGKQKTWGVLANEYGVSLWGFEIVLKLHSGDGCKTL